MSRLQLIAAVPLEAAPAAARIAGFAVVEGPRAALVFAPARTLPLAALLGRRAGRRAAAGAMIARQQALEALGAGGDVLPALPGLALGRADAAALLAAGGAAIDAGLSSLAGRVQHQVTLFAPEDARAAALAGSLAQALAPVAEDRIEMPTDGAGMAANVVVLSRASAVSALNAALEAFDAAHAGRLRIRLAGPSPGLSFVALDAARPEWRALAAAAAALGLDTQGAPPAPAAIEAAFRGLARHMHPDVAGRPGVDLGAAKAARALLLDAAEARAALAAAGLPTDATPPLARLLRDGRHPVPVIRPREKAA